MRPLFHSTFGWSITKVWLSECSLNQRKRPINWFIQWKFLEQKAKDKARSGSFLHKLQFYHHCLQFIFCQFSEITMITQYLYHVNTSSVRLRLFPPAYPFIRFLLIIYYGMQCFCNEYLPNIFFPNTDKRDTCILFYQRWFFIKKISKQNWKVSELTTKYSLIHTNLNNKE